MTTPRRNLGGYVSIDDARESNGKAVTSARVLNHASMSSELQAQASIEASQAVIERARLRKLHAQEMSAL